MSSPRPPAPIKRSIMFFAAAIIDLCTRHNASITSWFRTAKRNRAVGGVPTSRHLEGYGIDVVPDDHRQIPALMTAARALGFQAIDEKTHIHIEWDPPTPTKRT